MYTAQKGQASVRVSRKVSSEKEPERIIIEANCDSLELVVASYSRTISSLKSQIKQVNKNHQELNKVSNERHSNGIRNIFIAFVLGMALGIVLIQIIKKIWQKVF